MPNILPLSFLRHFSALPKNSRFAENSTITIIPVCLQVTRTVKSIKQKGDNETLEMLK